MTNLAELGWHDWKDFTDYWREADAEFLQSRSILRVDSLTQLTPPVGTASLVPNPGIGQVVYVKDVSGLQKDTLFMYASQGTGAPGTAGWVPYPALPKFLYASEDSASRVTFGHHPGDPTKVKAAVSLTPTGLAVLSDMTVLNPLFKVTAGVGISITTGAATAVLSTDATSLVSSVPVKSSGFVSSADISATGTISAGTVSAGTLTASVHISSSNTITASGQINASRFSAAQGLVSDKGAHLGDTTGALVRHTDWAANWPLIKVNGQTTGAINFSGGSATEMSNQLRVLNGRSIEFAAGGTGSASTGVLGPVIVSPSDPGGPNGTIWVVQ